MLIAHVIFYVSNENRHRALAALINEVGTVRSMRGCLAFLPFLDPTDPQGVGILHEWATHEDFAAYTASPGFAESGQTLRPLMVAAPVSRRFDANLTESVN